MDSIKVCVRVRPTIEQQESPSNAKTPVPPNRNLVKVIDSQMLHLEPRAAGAKSTFNFCFDCVFDGQSTQQQVFENTAKPMIESLMDGYNATIFAYGATGCGKTFTVSGTANNQGLIPLSVQRLFELINQSHLHKTVRISLSYLEIYNEKITDLLQPGEEHLKLREIGTGIEVSGLSQHEPASVEQVTELILRGNERRTQSPTAANAESSRSHAVLQIRLLQSETSAGLEEEQCMSTLSIIDLAGSERASTTQNKGQQLKEGAAINRSLLALGRCINALSTAQQFIPYRESNLTRLLKFSLGGNCKTLMIACVSPNAKHYDDTHNTLNYAKRASQIKTRTSRTTKTVNSKITEYRDKIEQQAATIKELQNQLRRGPSETSSVDEVLERYVKMLHRGEPQHEVLQLFRKEKSWNATRERILGYVESRVAGSGVAESPSKRIRTVPMRAEPMRVVPITPVRGVVTVPGSAGRFMHPGDVSFDTTLE